MSLKNYKAFFFDLDGTLLDTAGDLLAALNYILEKYNYNTVTLEQLLPHISYGSKSIITNILNREISDAELEQYKLEFIDAYHKIGHRHAEIFPGIEKVLELLNKNNIQWGIITNKTTSLAKPVVELFNFKQLQCKTVVCADTTAHAKPHPDPMLKACADINIHPKDCVFIGDAQTDIIAGRAVGMQTITAGYGYVPPELDLKTWQADHIVHSVAELYQLLLQD